MKVSKLIGKGMVIGVLVAFFFAGSAFAGAGEGPADLGSGVICEPAVWAVVVIQTDNVDYKITVRAKKIENCDVQKDAYFLDIANCAEGTTDGVDCPFEESHFINYVFGPSLFNIDNPIITKIKNFDSKPDPNDIINSPPFTLISFDAQLKGYHDGVSTCPTQ